MASQSAKAEQPTRADRPDGSEGIIFDIKRFAIHDGPGIRTTVFLKGCPLACRWCHNPESLTAAPELSIRAGRCRACGACVAACPRGAVSVRDGRAVTDSARCVLCGQCLEACPTGAREILGRQVTVAEVLAEIEKDLVFYEESGGGATFSGGEPLAQPEFLRELLAGCRARGIHAAVDTTCFAPWEVLGPLAELADLLLCDLKHMDSAAHERFTGVGNEVILRNIYRLAEAGHGVVVRMPLIAGVNDDDANVEAAGRFVASLPGVRRLDLLPYHEGGLSKLARLGRDPCDDPFGRPSEDRVSAVAARLERFGLTVKIGG